MRLPSPIGGRMASSIALTPLIASRIALERSGVAARFQLPLSADSVSFASSAWNSSSTRCS